MPRGCLVFFCFGFLSATIATAVERPNIIWIVSEDASPHIGCYGETTIETPHLDRMAEQGVRFTRAFVTCPVCSPSRSAMVSGMFQMTLGAHHHRSARVKGKGGGNEAYYDSYRPPEDLQLIPELFRDAGYYVVNGGKAKEDYNFRQRVPMYDGKDWKDRADGQPFFAQIQLSGGKNRKARIASPVNPGDVRLPPYYPDTPLMREDWARYLNSWIYADNEIGELFKRLKKEGIADSTIVFFWTDHGVSHARGKQFLYDEGIQVPLIAWFPDEHLAGTVREDPVVHIDVAATSLELADIEIPDYIQGQSLFGKEEPRTSIISGRDRCDETVDCIRCIRTKRFKYIRNFLSHRPHLQRNQYKDGKDIIQELRNMHANGELNSLQSRVLAATRPVEELYDLEVDPFETNNLAGRPDYEFTQAGLRTQLYDWMVNESDVGLIPEPIFEEMSRAVGSRYAVLRQPENEGLVRMLIRVIEAGEEEHVKRLERALVDPRPAVRYWAAVGCGRAESHDFTERLQSLLDDENPAVRIAAAQSLHRITAEAETIRIIEQEVVNENLLVGMYAIRALEDLGQAAAPALSTIENARESKFEFTRRIAKRIMSEWQAKAR